ncbi:unnamed protein product [Zymoseptoria tritici ST99CH_1A5]|uniref:Uncharacterized protein n=3 Tax=Zymoseptoria tritici TaxID=1047171 RepID=A0A1X7RFZ6_ZYMT9|nr:unnamed protein product [Zymoseptoria tritici ST99CH_3D7]SMR42278.1 unnamed protein product [Zymoseptoria tritici ST99CH_1E4]SMR44451.1 unnamed protein product [Zymoseptoria tritici ST99CH_3D1]SMY19606.1 unnamed protein product [Zymoseptoria tritici ST99CH_1A5]
MSYSSRKYQMLQRLGVEQLRPLREPTSSADGIEEERLCHLFDTNIPIRQTPVPGRRCPNCASRGATVWVIPGKRCPHCGTEVN